jgi:hypothetical protein
MDLFEKKLKLNNQTLHGYEQNITSAKTCRRITAYGTTFVAENYPAGTKVLDFGGGKFEDAKNYLAEHKIKCEVYDPYNRTYEENTQAINKKYDVLLCNNVLNTLTDDVIDKAIEDMILVMQHCQIKIGFITVYERNKTSIGEITAPDQYQRNEKTEIYVAVLEKYFYKVSVKKKVITVEGIR